MVAITPRLLYSTILFTTVVLILLVLKPTIMFHEDGQPRSFGVGPNKTLMSFGTAVVLLALLSFFTFTMIDLVFGSVV